MWTIIFKTITGHKHKIVREAKVNTDKTGAGNTLAVTTSSTSVDPTAKQYGVFNSQGEPNLVTQPELEAAYRALRVASWQAVFYLITSDILGWFNAPYAFRELGYGPGVMVFVFLYALAILAGQILWKIFCSLDSSRYPIVCYADLGERVIGRPFRHVCNFLQSAQLFFNVALLVNSNGEILADLSNFSFCFLAVCAIWAIVGAAGGQIRSLKNFAPVATINIWLNVATITMTLYGIYNYLPDPSQAGYKNLGLPKAVSGWIPSYDQGVYQQALGVQFAVFAYGGAMIFPGILPNAPLMLDD